MRKCSGFSFVEVIVALGLTAAFTLILSAVWLYAQQLSSSLNQAKFAEQCLNNVATELLANHHAWDPSMLASWQAALFASLPQAKLSVTPNHIQIDWPSRISVKVRCETQANLSCVGMDI